MTQYKTGFPKQLAITHKYTGSHQLSWTSPNANVEYFPYGVNCLYDPYLFAGGAQPLYFDQLAAIYNHYTVMKARIRATIVPNRNEAFVGGIYIDDDSSPAVTALDVVNQQPSAVYKVSQKGCRSFDSVQIMGLQVRVWTQPDGQRSTARRRCDQPGRVSILYRVCTTSAHGNTNDSV